MGKKKSGKKPAEPVRDEYHQVRMDVEAYALRRGKPELARRFKEEETLMPSADITREEMAEALRLHVRACNYDAAVHWGRALIARFDDAEPLRRFIQTVPSRYGLDLARALGDVFTKEDWWNFGCRAAEKMDDTYKDADAVACLAFDAADRRREGYDLLRAQAVKIGNEAVARTMANRTGRPLTRAELRRLFAYAFKSNPCAAFTLSLAREIGDRALAQRLVRRLARDTLTMDLTAVQRAARLLGVPVATEDLFLRLCDIRKERSFYRQEALRIARLLSARSARFANLPRETMRWASRVALREGRFREACLLARRAKSPLTAEDALEFYVDRSGSVEAYEYAKRLLAPKESMKKKRANAA